MKTLDVIAAILLVVGGLNWGLWGAFEFDLVATIFAAVYQATSVKAIQGRWHLRPAAA
jgi:uncharacterized membrane protein YuzA (DUF378 family)